MNREFTGLVDPRQTIRAEEADGAVDGLNVDTQGADAATIIVDVGAITGAAGDATVILQESDTDGSGYTNVAAADIVGSQPTLSADTIYKFGYTGSKRHLRAQFALGGETNVSLSVVIVLGKLSRTEPGQTFSR